MTNYPFESPAFTEAHGISPSPVQKSYLRMLLRSLVTCEPNSSLTYLASQFCGEIDWNHVSVRRETEVEEDGCTQVNVTFPLDNGKQALMQVYEWCADRGHWGVGLGTLDGARLVFKSLRGNVSSVAADRFYGSLVKVV